MVVVDTNVILHGRISSSFDKVLFVQEVIEEVKSQKGVNRLRNLDYIVRNPSENAIEKVKKRSDEINSPTSKADERLLALAIDLDEKIVTDDIALQNLARHLKADFEGYFEDPLEKKFKWEIICRNCGSKVSGSKCSNCGSSSFRRRQFRCN